MAESEPDTEVVLDLHEIELLCELLNRQRVQSFQGLGITLVFKDDTEAVAFEATKPAAQVQDDGHSTSNKRVDGFRNGALYPWQNNKVMNFKGELE